LKQCRGSLKVVNLLGCNIGDKGCEIVINSLLSHRNNYSSMFELNLDSNAITKNSSPLIALLISSNYPITKLDLGYNPLCSVVYESLYQNNTLTELTLRDTSLTSSDLQSLGQMLASNNTLSVLDISFNDIAADGIADWKNISLHKLIMQGCTLGVNGADKIGQILCHNKSITYVDLTDENNIGDEGVEKLVEHMKSNNTVRHLRCLAPVLVLST